MQELAETLQEVFFEMTVEVYSAHRPALYAGRRVPFAELESEEFARFVHGALVSMSARLGFKNLSLPDVGADGGFDSYAWRESDGSKVAIQCKRYKKSLGANDLACELAKVALNAGIEKSTVRQYLLITSGTVAQKVRQWHREDSRASLVQKAIELAQNASKLSGTFQRAVSAQLDVSEVIANFVMNADMTIWSGSEFDVQLGTSWSVVSDLVAKYFTLQTLVAEHPRPNFDEVEYLHRCQLPQQPTSKSLHVLLATPPPNIRRVSAGNPMAEPPPPIRNARAVLLQEALLSGEPGISLLLGRGGAGKSIALQLLRQTMIVERQANPDTILPVLVDLSAYGHLNLSELVEIELGLQGGRWTSVPGSIHLICDGLDLLPPHLLAKLLTEIRAATSTERVTVLISCRDGGPSGSIVVPELNRCWKLLPFGPAQALELARQTLDAIEIADFMHAWLERAKHDHTLALPQGVAAAVMVFKRRSALPSTRSELLAELFRIRSEREQERANTLEAHASFLLDSTVVYALRKIAWELWFLNVNPSFTRAELLICIDALLSNSDDSLDRRMAAEVGTVEIARIFLRQGFLKQVSGNLIAFEHDVVAAYFAAPILAKHWHTRNTLTSRTEDAWILAAPSIPESESQDYIRHLLDRDPVTAALAAREGSYTHSMQHMFIEKAKSAASRFEVAEASASLGILATIESFSFLRSKAAQHDALHWKSYAPVALATGGDEIFLAQLLPRVDYLTSISVMKITGGDIDLWHRAAPLSALAIARRRVDTQPGPLVASIRTLARWGGTQEDARRIQISMSVGNVPVDLFCMYALALYHIDKGAAVTAVARAATNVTDPAVKFELIGTLHHWGESVDVNWLTDYALRQGVSELQELVAQNRAAVILGEVTPTSSARAKLIEATWCDDEKVRARAWRVAGKHRMKELVATAKDILLGVSSGDKGAAATFARSCEWDESVMAEISDAICRRLRDGPLVIGDEVSQAQLLLDWGYQEVAFCIIRDRVMHAIQGIVECQNSEDSARRRAKFADELFPWMPAATRTTDGFSALDAETILRADPFSTNDDYENFLKVMFTKAGSEAALQIAQTAGSAWQRARIIEIASEVEPNEVTEQALCSALSQLIQSPITFKRLTNAMLNLWGEPVLCAALDAMLERQDSVLEHDRDIRRRMVQFLSEHITLGLGSHCLSAAIERCNNNELREELRFLEDRAARRGSLQQV